MVGDVQNEVADEGREQKCCWTPVVASQSDFTSREAGEILLAEPDSDHNTPPQHSTIRIRNN